jgi:hypothetical protein
LKKKNRKYVCSASPPHWKKNLIVALSKSKFGFCQLEVKIKDSGYKVGAALVTMQNEESWKDINTKRR